MSARERSWLFAAVALAATVVVCLLVAVSGQGPNEGRARASTGEPAVVAAADRARAERRAAAANDPSPARRRAEAEDSPPGWRPRPVHDGAVKRARAFVSALLALESGERGAAMVTALRRSATRDFARFVLAEPPRVPAGHGRPPPGRLVRLESVPGRRVDRRELVATIARAGRQSGMLLTLRRRGGRWWVSAIH